MKLKNFITWGPLLMAIAITLWLVPLISKKDKGPEPLTEEAALLVEAEVKNINSKLDSEGFDHAIFKDMENLIRDNEQLRGEAKLWYDSAQHLTGTLDSRTKQLRELTTVNATLKANLLEAHQTDSGYSYSDRWANIDFILPTDGSDPHFNLAYDIEFNFARVQEKGNLFRSGKSYTDVWVSDKRATINGVKRVKIMHEEPKRSLTVSPFTSATLHSNDITTAFGAEILYKNGLLGLGYRYEKPMNSRISGEKMENLHILTLSSPLIFKEW